MRPPTLADLTHSRSWPAPRADRCRLILAGVEAWSSPPLADLADCKTGVRLPLVLVQCTLFPMSPQPHSRMPADPAVRPDPVDRCAAVTSPGGVSLASLHAGADRSPIRGARRTPNAAQKRPAAAQEFFGKNSYAHERRPLRSPIRRLGMPTARGAGTMVTHGSGSEFWRARCLVSE